MKVIAESMSGSPARDKVVSARDAVALIQDGDVVALDGFMGQGFAEEVVLALEDRFVDTQSPSGLSLVYPVAVGNRGDRGLDHLAHPGLIRRVTAGHWGMCPRLQAMAVGGEIEAHNLPQGVISQLFRDTAAGKPGLLTHVGLGTFVDPRHGGGKLNDRTVGERVRLMEIDGEEYLFYKAFDLDVAILRGTTADPDGNITMEREALTLEAQAIATAVHNAGGLVIVQVERLADHATLDPRRVKIPGVLVDCVVHAAPERHTQTFATAYSPAFSGELRAPLNSVARMALDPRKVIARRAAMELRPNSVVNLGIGIPEGVASVAHEEGVLSYLTLTAEPGVIGGFPQAGLDFGSAINPQAILDQPAQFDFYDGGGLDAAFLGMAQLDREGNVNVSRFGPRLAGAGGFINISQNAKRVLFLGTFLAPSRCRVVDGVLRTDTADAAAKVVEAVEQRTFSGSYALARHQPVLYITERCVFRLTDNGLGLTEIAPGLDLDRDVLAHLSFKPAIATDLVEMDARIFVPEPMGIAADLLEIPMDSRFAYDASRNTFFLNMEGLSLTRGSDIDEIRDATDAKLAPLDDRVHMVINYDNFYVAPELYDDYLSAVRALSDRYYLTATRYSTSSFMRLKLREGLTRRGLAPHVYESRTEATAWQG